MITSDRLLTFVKAWEGFKHKASGDPLVKGIRDIGYGHVIRPDESFDEPITKLEADALLRVDMQAVSDGVNRLVHVPLAQNQFDALCSFAYNVGLDIDADTKAEGLGDSTLLKHINAARYDAAALQFALWCFAGGKKIPGLLKRRAAEQAIFSLADYSVRP